jgi:Cd2+/Zn2+-exporting ATPase
MTKKSKEPTMNKTRCSCNASSGADTGKITWKNCLPAMVSFVMVAMGILTEYVVCYKMDETLRLLWYIMAYCPVGLPVWKDIWNCFKQKDFFNEFSLMTLAALGAFCIGEYPEGVAVMLFYSVGELFQEAAVYKAQKNIKALLDLRPDVASVLRNGVYVSQSPENVAVGESIQVKVGEKVPMDGVLLSADSYFDTSILTGESKPKTLHQQEEVLAGMINVGKVVEIQVTKIYSDSSLAKILEMVQHAASRKAKTELFIHRFAKIYTPIVFGLALLIVVVPFFFRHDYIVAQWLYRALVFLVISCPCALVISVPLSYFSGIGTASRNGILFKGANYIDSMSQVDTVVMDKTGTLTKGVFKVQEIVPLQRDVESFMQIIKAIESYSNHPIAKAIAEYEYADNPTKDSVENVEEMAGYGLKGMVNGQVVLAGNARLMQKYRIQYDKQIDFIVNTVVLVAINNEYAGYLSIADELKEDALLMTTALHKLGIRKTILLSGDNDAITKNTAIDLGIDAAYGNLLPEDKLHYMETLKKNTSGKIAFIGDGINDAPVLALSDIGIAMGGMGADAAIEVADVVIRTDQPSKLITAIKIAKSTRTIVLQNIILTLSVKGIIFLLGAIGVASLWGAVFADVGVALLAILNAVRILRKKF